MARLKWQPTHGQCWGLSSVSTPASRVDHFQDLIAPGDWPELGKYGISSTQFRTSLTESTNQKRKAKNKEMKSVDCEIGKYRDKKMKPNIEEDEEPKITEKTETSKQSSKASKEVQKSDYVHVRARRGQATDSHSLAERARREKISNRMKYLQNMVPGSNKIAGKAGMLDEIINYVQSLQQQVEFLSMKLAALDFINVDALFAKQVFPLIEIAPETANCSSNFNELGVGSSSVTIPEAPLFNSSSVTHFELSSTWGGDLLSLHSMSFEKEGPPLLSPSSFLSQQCSCIEDENETFLDHKLVPF